jgi:hypothetical protein
MMAKKKELLLDIPVAFGNVSIGDLTARLGVTIDRGSLTVSKADKDLCCRRLTGKIIARPNGVKGDQDPLPGVGDDFELKGIFDVKGFSTTGKKIGVGLTFSLDGIDVSNLAHFAKREGMLQVDGIEDLPEDSSSDTDDE